ncbi:MAG: ATP-binding protein [Desulfobacterales bacterium]|nr:ATP-binding protein [Desulfobacterales bacterium]
MPPKKKESALRRRVEGKLKEAAIGSEDLSGVPPERMTSLMHELQVHQIELKMRNDELRRIQGELEKTRDHYAHLYDFAPVGYFTVSEKEIIEEVNLTGAAMTGIEHSALIGKPFSRLILKDDQDIFYEHRQRLLKTDTCGSCEVRLVKKDGHDFYARLECMVIKTEGDGLRQIRAAVSDITDLKQAEKKIKEHSEKLEKQVDFLQRMEAMGTFAGGIAHDFANLLTIIISYSNFALNAVGAENPVREDIEKIMRNAKHGLSLTHWLLLFSRNQPQERKITDLNALISDMEKMLRRVITNKINLVMSLDPDLSRILVDPAQMELMIINLVFNAVEAMPQEGWLTIATANEESGECPVQEDSSGQQEPKMVLSVSDTGIGMDQETLSKIFEPFFTTKKKGTGLGLAIAFEAVQKNDGIIRVDSRPGQGSTFKIYLPSVREE